MALATEVYSNRDVLTLPENTIRPAPSAVPAALTSARGAPPPVAPQGEAPQVQQEAPPRGLIVQIEGVGRVQFPAGMGQDEIAQIIETQILPQQSQSQDDGGMARQAALTGRAVGEGVATTATALSDMTMNSPAAQMLAPANPLAMVGAGVQGATGHSPAFWAVRAFNKLTGSNIPETETFQGLIEQALTQAGAPVPKTSGERLAFAAEKGAAAGLAGAGAGGFSGLANAARAGISGASGGTAAEVAKQAGYGPVAQTAAGIAGGFAPGAIEGLTRGAVQLARGAARPLTRTGQQAMAAQILQENARNPRAAAASLEQAAEVVPGSARTTGEASRDVGLLALEKGVRGRNAAAFGERLSEQNAARQAELSRLAGSPAELAAARTARDAATGPMREQALRNPVGSTIGAPVEIVQQTMDDILASPAGKRESISKAIEWAKGQIGKETDPATLYEIRKDLQLAQMGKLRPSSPNAPNASTLAQARGQLGQVVEALDNAIESAAPGFKAYLERYKELSKPIDQMRVIQEIQRRSQLTTADVTTQQNFMGASAYSRALDTALQKGRGKLTPDQLSRLEAIRTDLQYGQAINSGLVKAPGSDTFQNLSIAQVIGAGPNGSHPALRALARPLTWLYRAAGSDEKVSQILSDAMLDPKLGAQMLTRATPRTMAEFAGRLRRIREVSLLATAPASAATLAREPAESATRE